MREQVEQGLAEIHQLLQAWVNEVLHEVQVSFACPEESPSGERLMGLYLLDLVQAPSPARGSGIPPLQINLRYLVTARAESPEKAHGMLCALVFDALERPGFEVRLEEAPAHVWTAFGVIPRPSFQLIVPLRLEREQKRAPRIRKPPEIREVAVRGLNGLVVSSERIPIASARVELPSVGLATVTDAKGRFQFLSVPVKPRTKQFRVLAKSRELLIALEVPEREEEPLIIYFDVWEESHA